jgi:hypothetical protein
MQGGAEKRSPEDHRSLKASQAGKANRRANGEGESRAYRNGSGGALRPSKDTTESGKRREKRRYKEK